MRELLKLWKASPDGAVKQAARGEIAKVRSFWGTGVSYLGRAYQITALNGKPVKESALTTCDLLVALRSGDWRDRARSATLLLRGEQGVPDALVHAMADDYLDVAAHAMHSLEGIFGLQIDIDFLPDLDELQKWWAKAGPGITAKLAAPACAKN